VKSAYEILRTLEEHYPDRLPHQRDYTEQKVLVSIGHQEIIRFIRRLLTEEE
jgi:hypothetical protein